MLNRFLFQNKLRKVVYIIIAITSIVRYIVLSNLYPFIPPLEQFYIWALGMLIFVIVFEWIYGTHRYLNRFLPFETHITERLLLQTISAMMLIFLFAFVIINFLAPHFLPTIPKENYNIPATYISVVVIVFGINMGFFGEYFFRAWREKITETERLAKQNALVQKEYAQMKFYNLQNQLNPHFLFNSITSLHTLIYENQALASQFLDNLAKVYRYVLQHKEKELVSLETELNFIEQYVFLLKTRFEESFCWEYQISKDAKQKRLPPVTLQILIENALKHNTMSPEKPLRIRLYEEENYLCIGNNLQRKNIVETSNKIGLENLKTLYSYLSPTSLQVVEEEGFFVVKIPLM